jgi:hypothetical protein
VTLLQQLESYEARLVDQRAQELWEEDGPDWLSWDSLSHEVRDEYRRIARQESAVGGYHAGRNL